MEVIVAAWIMFEEKILFIKHHKSKLWLPVGGHVEEEEFLENALRREVKEEVNLEIQALQPATNMQSWRVGEKVIGEILPFRVFNKVRLNDSKQMYFEYAVETLNPEELKIQEEEIDDHIWLTRKELAETKLIQPILKKIGLETFDLRDKLRG